jgi:chitosanase
MKKIFFVPIFVTILLASPDEPTNLSFNAVTKSSITLNWDDNSNNEIGFKIYRKITKDDNSTLKLIYITKPNITSYTDTFLYPDTNYTYQVKATDDPILSDTQKHITRQIISVFENTKKELQYWYAENIGDNRGVTAGIAGFTTQTWDLGEVLRRYENVNPNNRLSKFKNLDENISSYQNELIYAWGLEANSTQEFRDVQDKMADELYYYPAMQEIYKLNFELPISMLIMYDTYIQHGLDNETINENNITGLSDIIEQTKITYPDGKPELDFLSEFLDIREEILQTTKGWENTIYRVKALRDILKSGNTELTPTIYMHLQYNDGSTEDFNITSPN